MRHPFLFLLIPPAFLLLLHTPASRSADNPLSHPFIEWQVIEVKSGHAIAFEAWVALLNEKDVIYLGEEHRNNWHIDAALKILRALLEYKREPALAVEMFGWDGQSGLDQYLSESETSRDHFLEASRWEQNWGGPFDEYAPLISFAREHRLPILALNPPRPLVRRVASQGLARALSDAEMGRWGMQDHIFVDTAVYRDMIVRQLRLCHGGMSDDGYQRMYEASLFRDESMAKTIADYLARTKTETDGRIGPLVSYTGGGHIQYHLPVPDRVLLKTNGEVKQTTVYMTSLDSGSVEEVKSLLQESIADYVWLTPVGAHGPAKRCR